MKHPTSSWSPSCLATALIVANATGCSSIYGGNLPTTPWAVNNEGRGPAWSNSLFEDNAEFGLGMRLTLDKQSEYARELLPSLRSAGRRRPGRRACSTPTRPAKPGIARAARAGGRPQAAPGRASTTRSARDLLSLADFLVTQERLDHGRRRLGL